MKCPTCGDEMALSWTMSTCDGYMPWTDVDGTRYCGPARREVVTKCAKCGQVERRITRHGKPFLSETMVAGVKAEAE